MVGRLSIFNNCNKLPRNTQVLNVILKKKRKLC